MKKIIQTNIGGFVFHMDEDSYEKLKAYLDTLKSHFSTEEGAIEIMQDIEHRIAEIFKDTLKTPREVVTMQDVEVMIGIMGQPEIIAEENASNNSTKQKGSRTSSGPKRLYRDPDNKVLGGVCGGLGAYFGIDPVIFRLIFGITFIAWGTGLLIYFLLWIAMPKARTTAEKLEMRGEKINVSTIEKTVKEELEGVKQSFQDIKSSGTAEKVGNAIQNFLNALAQIIHRLLKIIGKFLAVFFIIFGIIFLSIFIWAIIFGEGISISLNQDTYEIPLSTLVNLISENSLQTRLAIISVLLILGIPLIMLIYVGIKILFRIQHNSRWLNYTALGIWIFGIMLGGYTAIKVLSNFKNTYSDTSVIDISLEKGKTLWLKALKTNTNILWDDFLHVDENGKVIPVGDVKLNIVRNDKDSLCRLEITRFSRGKTREEAGINAKKIQYEVIQSDSVLIFSPILVTTNTKKYRAQQVKITLKIPDQQKIYIDESMESVLFDIDNVLDAWDYDMDGHTWIMKKNGLDCLDCPPYMDNRNKFLDN
ncbi:MAG: PspC domain-containing protein [Flavobacteriales bacterium]|nr:PspC domain-containing protein [Flavobacteriales bacterium]